MAERIGDSYLKKCCKGDSAKVKRKVLLRVVDGAKCEFQILDLDTGELAKTPFALLWNGGAGSNLMVGSIIYTVGKPQYRNLCRDEYSELYSFENEIVEVHEGLSYFDLTNPEMGWRKGPLFKEDEYTPKCVALCGKLYVFRSSKWSCFGEVFDPKLNIWEPLPKPPPFSGRVSSYGVSPPLVVDHLRGRILVHFLFSTPGCSIYAYYPADASWDCLVDRFDGIWGGPIVFVDGILYIYARKSKQLVEAYDLSRKRWLNVVLSSDFDDYSKQVFDSLHHLGNDLLCFTTYSHELTNFDSRVTKDHTVVISLQFRAQRSSDRDQVLLTPVSCKSSPLESCYNIYGQIAI
ncbi:hypothetical protein DM860_004065 [Cuscuta australis]|uniref:F-box associated domain-containing protein n=1 Tax=Cuscuta australis TaxID=267555 RepID=A0A328CZU3_9ASTE|nr:hypothetical protein DM860_004065 [Cuscuta australis]